MKATVVIPTFNRSVRLAELLRCLEAQGDSLARVIVSDDGSTDDTSAVVRSFEGRLPIVYAHQENRGFRAGQARNLGIERAIGDVIIFVDDDVLVASDFVSSHIAAHARASRPRVAIGFRYRAFEVPREPPKWEDIVGREGDDRTEVLGPHAERITSHATPWFFVYSCNFSITSVRREGTAEDPRFDDAFVGWGMEDIEFGYRLHHTGYEVVAAPRAAVLHIEDPKPRDPFRCEARSVPAPVYDSYVRNSVYFMDKYPEDSTLAEIIRADMRWFVRDEVGAWVKNGYANDVEAVVSLCRQERMQPQVEPSVGL